MIIVKRTIVLPELVERVRTTLLGAVAGLEVILVNDGSRDGSWETITALARTHPWVRGINLMRNYGQHNALLCGIREARYDIILTMDDDLQHPVSEIASMLAALSPKRGAPIGSGRGKACSG